MKKLLGKKWIALGLASLLALSLTACAKDDGSEAEEAASSAVAEASSAAEEAEPEAAAPEETADDGGEWVKPELTFESTDEPFDPYSEDSITFEDMRAQFGAIPVTGSLNLQGSVKAFEVEYWRTMRDGGYDVYQQIAQDAGRDITVETRGAASEADESGQLSLVKDTVRKGCDAIMLSAISDANCLPGIDDAHDAGILVYAVNSELPGCDKFIGPNAKNAGATCAAYLAELMNHEGQCAVVIGLPKSVVALNRTAGFVEYMEENEPNIEVVAQQNADWDRLKAKDLTSTWITQFPELKAIWSNADCMVYGVVEAVQESGKDIIVTSLDGESEALGLIREGKLQATLGQFPDIIGLIASEVATRQLAGQEFPRTVWSPTAIINSDNVDTPSMEIVGYEAPEFE